jgi:hypothetical protein
MPETSIKWPIAIGPDGEYARIENAESGGLYVCPQCSARFIARQGAVKSWHFAHYPGAVCTGEGARHDITKHMIAAALCTIKELPLSCECQSLFAESLPVEFTNIHVEHVVHDYRVDIACESAEHLLCIEVVDSNPVSDAKRDVLGDSLVEIDISKMSNEAIFRGASTRQILITQLGQVVQRLLGDHMFVHVWLSKCWKCEKDMSVATVCSDIWSDVLPPEVLATLKAHANLEHRCTSAVPSGYWANVCPRCKAVQGDWYLHDEMLEVLIVRGDDAVKTIAVPLGFRGGHRT